VENTPWSPESRRPQWSPDSHRIVFSSNASGRAELYIVNSDGSQLHRLSTGTQNAVASFWSADGRWIYFESHWGLQAGASQEPAAIWKLPVEGGTAIRLTKEGRYDPMESVDGTRVFMWCRTAMGWSARTKSGQFPPMAGTNALKPVATGSVGRFSTENLRLRYVSGLNIHGVRANVRRCPFNERRKEVICTRKQ
jgi:dipeptidyl aminopeptidase/acylaminoacyl peptidase